MNSDGDFDIIISQMDDLKARQANLNNNILNIKSSVNKLINYFS